MFVLHLISRMNYALLSVASLRKDGEHVHVPMELIQFILAQVLNYSDLQPMQAQYLLDFQDFTAWFNFISNQLNISLTIGGINQGRMRIENMVFLKEVHHLLSFKKSVM